MTSAKYGRQGREGRRDVCGMRWKDRIFWFWVFPAGRNWSFAEPRDEARMKVPKTYNLGMNSRRPVLI
jgi:hypothetical protein